MTILLASLCSLAIGPADDPRPVQARVVVVIGAPGDPEYDEQFRSWADRWADAASPAGAELIRIGDDEPDGMDDRDRLRETLASSSSAGGPLWVVFIGHGTFDGQEAKFNLRGPDVSAAELAGWLAGTTGPTAVINCASASGPFINALSGGDRVVVTATRSGDEQNLARFGGFLSEAIADPSADLDKDDQVSLLEAYLMAGARVAEFYRTEARLATEHPLLDDNGDGLGTPPDWFRGVRATKRPADDAEADGVRAHQFHLIPSDRERDMPAEVRARRDELEAEIADLRDRKAELGEDAYYERLEPLLVELARLYRSLGSPDAEDDPGRD
ncbi:hypothetical protein [Tautonia plasticadhaerens]|uniref:Caspase domain protein n=1 Tax=Tautonia plasticadhaerens TaxID=2527974 RepID=A0A518GW06_9BACT|nr:hypothetical protein [Tautonia plasticadhaerens]QDV32783.1 hypothetical protein ElP_06230 [Tautonia plasticadhaerens]